MEVFTNRELRRIFEPKMEAVTGRWIKQHNLNSLPHIIRIIRYSGLDGRYIQHEWERKEMHTNFWSVNLKERDNFESLGI